jgi:hypothetical protein
MLIDFRRRELIITTANGSELWLGTKRRADLPEVETRSDHVEHTRAWYFGPLFCILTQPPRIIAADDAPAQEPAAA